MVVRTGEWTLKESVQVRIGTSAWILDSTKVGEVTVLSKLPDFYILIGC